MSVRISQPKKPSLNIHRFTPTNRLNKLKKHSKRHVEQITIPDEHDVIDKNSKEYLESLINKIYFQLNSDDSGKTSEEYLPALTSSSNVDLQLHAFIGLLLKNFVLNWYDRITDDYSNEFLTELIFIMAHVTRNLEEKLRKIEYKELILDDLFVICHVHFDNYVKLHKLTGSQLSCNGTQQELFQMFEPHYAITNQSLYLNALSDNFLQRTLPNDNFNSELTRSILINIMSEFVLKLTVEKLSETYLIWELIGKVCDCLLQAPEQQQQPPHRSSSTWSDLVSNISHAIAYTTSTLSSSSSRDTIPAGKPILSYHVWSFGEEFMDFVNKFPILTMMITIFMKLFHNSSKLNRLLRNLVNNLIFKFLISEHFIINILSMSRTMLFPQDDDFYLQPRFIPTTDEELSILMTQTRGKILSVFDKFKSLKMLMYYENDLLLFEDVTNFLQSFRDKDINKHLVLLIMDLIFLRLFPDMAAAAA